MSIQSTKRDLGLLATGYGAGLVAMYILSPEKIEKTLHVAAKAIKSTYNTLTFKNIVSASASVLGLEIAVRRVIAPSIKSIIDQFTK